MIHKHKPIHIKYDGLMEIQECEVCHKRRVVHIGAGRKNSTTFDKWMSREECAQIHGEKRVAFVWGK